MKKLFVVVVLLLAIKFLQAQQTFHVPLSAKANITNMQEEWNVSLMAMDNEEQDEFSATENLDLIKDQVQQFSHHTNSPSNRSFVDTAVVIKNIDANVYNNSVPNDNDIAVSNTGYLISVMNTSIFKYDLNADTSMGTLSLGTFCSVLGNTQGKFDPKVIYDPEQNKFVVVFLAGFTDATSSIILAFSESDNPNGNWNFYQLPGNPLNDTLWTDYPMIAMTHQELFVTVNLLYNNMPWQTGWNRSIIWQINKDDGYNGDSLTTLLNDSVRINNRFIRNLCPVKGGSQLYGPDIYFLSDRNLSADNDSLFLIHVMDTIGAGAGLTTQLMISSQHYFVPVNGKQPGTYGDLATNDSRVLGAFIENNQIQFAGNTTDTATGFSALYHGIVSNPATAPSVSIQIISADSMSFGYPNLSYAGLNATDNRSIIDHLKSSSTINPGNAAMVFDGTNSYSNFQSLANGLSYHNVLSGNERWGDYTGSQRWYNHPGYVWVNGSYATIYHKMNTYISLLKVADAAPMGIQNFQIHPAQIHLFPNPASDLFTVEFQMTEESNCTFQLVNLNGQLVKILLQQPVAKGKNQFSFSLDPLPAGIYFMQVVGQQGVVVSEKVMKD